MGYQIKGETVANSGTITAAPLKSVGNDSGETPPPDTAGLPNLDMTVEDAVKRLTGHDIERIAKTFGTSNFEKLDTLTPWAIAWAHLSKADRAVTKSRIMELDTEQVTGLFRSDDDDQAG